MSKGPSKYYLNSMNNNERSVCLNEFMCIVVLVYLNGLSVWKSVKYCEVVLSVHLSGIYVLFESTLKVLSTGTSHLVLYSQGALLRGFVLKFYSMNANA